jgi:hypothetical protein
MVWEIADAVRTHVYRKWPTKESRKCWERGAQGGVFTKHPNKLLQSCEPVTSSSTGDDCALPARLLHGKAQQDVWLTET